MLYTVATIILAIWAALGPLVSTATDNRFLGRYQSGRDDDSPCADKEKYEYSK